MSRYIVDLASRSQRGIGLSCSRETIKKKADYQYMTVNYIASCDTKYKTVFVSGTTGKLEINILFMALWSWKKSISLPVS